MLQSFVAALRKAGVIVSPAEAIDAARALRTVRVESREEFRLALRATLAKTRESTRIFDTSFDRFFRAPSVAGASGKGRSAASGPGERWRPGPVQPPEESASGRRNLDSRLERRGRRGRLKVILRPPRSGAEPTGGRPPERQRIHPSRAPARPRQLAAPGGTIPTSSADVRRRDLDVTRPPRGEDEILAREVPRLVRAIRLRAGRRMRRSRRGRLWGARVMRVNVGTGGVPFILPYRRRRPRRPRVVLLVDVSWSVLRASSLFLMMARNFLDMNRRTSVLFFVDRCLDVTEAVAAWDGESALSLKSLVGTLEDLDPMAPSDYGRAFYQAAHGRSLTRSARLKGGGRDTLLVILGDARANFRDPQAWAFDDLTAGCRKVIWLNPEPEARWDTGDSVLKEYLPFCDVLCEARDLEGIARGVTEIVKSL